MIPGLLASIEKIIDGFFYPAMNYLSNVNYQLYKIQIEPQRYLKLDYFLGPISMLGPGWIALIDSVIGALIMIFLVFSAKALWNLYLHFKESVQWW